MTLFPTTTFFLADSPSSHLSGPPPSAYNESYLSPGSEWPPLAASFSNSRDLKPPPSLSLSVHRSSLWEEWRHRMYSHIVVKCQWCAAQATFLAPQPLRPKKNHHHHSGRKKNWQRWSVCGLWRWKKRTLPAKLSSVCVFYLQPVKSFSEEWASLCWPSWTHEISHHSLPAIPSCNTVFFHSPNSLTCFVYVPSRHSVTGLTPNHLICRSSFRHSSQHIFSASQSPSSSLLKSKKNLVVLLLFQTKARDLFLASSTKPASSYTNRGFFHG